MTTYNFEQFNVEITDPIITINEETIGFNKPAATASVEITMETDNAKVYGVKLEDMPLYAPILDDNDIVIMVDTKLVEYEI